MFVDRSLAQDIVDGKRDEVRATRTSRFVVRADLATTLKTSASPTASALLTTDEPQSSGTGTQVVIVAASASAASSSAGRASTSNTSTVVAIVMAIVFALVVAVASRLHYKWRRRAARKHNSSFIQYQYGFYTDAAPGPRRVSVVPRDNLPPPIRPPDWDARSAAASSTAATFDSPITASEPTTHGHGHGHAQGRVVPAPAQGQMQSLDEKLRDIFYPAQAPNSPARPAPVPVSFVPSFSSPSPTSISSAAPPISPPPPAAGTGTHGQLPSFVPEPITSPQAWTNPPPSPLLVVYPARTPAAQSTFLSPWTPVGPGRGSYGPPGRGTPPGYSASMSEVHDVKGRPPSYSRH